jgi:hypothetical protein
VLSYRLNRASRKGQNETCHRIFARLVPALGH